MDKPIFLFCPGVAKSSTTFLSDVLIKYKFFNYGYAKECSYLDFIFYGKNNLPEFYIGHPEHLEIISKNSNYFYNDFDNFSKKYTVENYLNYYLDLYKRTDFSKGVCDFSQSYNLLPENFLNEVKHELEKFFVVKCILLFRDPVKRLYSFSNMLHPTKSREFFLENLMLNTLEFSGSYYQYVIEKFETIFLTQNLFISSMEEVYSKKNFNQLKLFLGIENTKIDIDNVDKYNTFSRKYREKLTDDDIIFAKKKLYNNYKYWKFKYGYLPTGWHEM